MRRAATRIACLVDTGSGQPDAGGTADTGGGHTIAVRHRHRRGDRCARLWCVRDRAADLASVGIGEVVYRCRRRIPHRWPECRSVIGSRSWQTASRRSGRPMSRTHRNCSERRGQWHRHPPSSTSVCMTISARCAALVTDPEGRPAALATVYLKSTSTPWDANTATGVDGLFSLSGVPAGDYTVRLSHPELRHQWFDGKTRRRPTRMSSRCRPAAKSSSTTSSW